MYAFAQLYCKYSYTRKYHIQYVCMYECDETCSDFQHDVSIVVRISGQQQQDDLLLQRLLLGDDVPQV